MDSPFCLTGGSSLIFVQMGLRCQAAPGNNEFILHRLLNSGTKPSCDQSQHVSTREKGSLS